MTSRAPDVPPSPPTSPGTPAEAPGTWVRRSRSVREYFEDRAENWIRLTSDAPLTGVRETVRDGRRRMRDTLASWVLDPAGVSTVLDAGCGPGELSLHLARSGLRVTGVDLSEPLVEAGRERAREAGLEERVHLHAGDMLAPPGGPWDCVVAMDSFLYYDDQESVEGLVLLAGCARDRLLVTVAPRTLVLGAMHRVGALFPRRDRAPGIQPVPIDSFFRRLLDDPRMDGWERGREVRVKSGFYISHAVELRRTRPDTGEEGP
ncbi:MAG: magnesium protoporphyrin IX methyltransferase [Gemmatimonadales bacterium]|nr:MAG: magnesium protoporphyrin IX methyltransferase [Gemmatimonadales bacterium]